MDMMEAIKNFKVAMSQIAEEDVFTEEGWKKCVDALEFMPPEARAGFLSQFVLVATQM